MANENAIKTNKLVPLDSAGIEIDGVTVRDTFVFGSGVPILAKYQITHEALTDAATSQVVDVLAAAADLLILRVVARLDTFFAGPDISSMGLDVGEDFSPDADAYLLRKTIESGGSLTEGQLVGHTTGDSGPAWDQQPILPSGQKLQATFSVLSGSGNVDAASAGQVTIWVLYVELT